MGIAAQIMQILQLHVLVLSTILQFKELSFLQCCGMGQNVQRLLDKNLKFHRIVAYAICLFTGQLLFSFRFC